MGSPGAAIPAHANQPTAANSPSRIVITKMVLIERTATSLTNKQQEKVSFLRTHRLGPVAPSCHGREFYGRALSISRAKVRDADLARLGPASLDMSASGPPSVLDRVLTLPIMPPQPDLPCRLRA